MAIEAKARELENVTPAPTRLSGVTKSVFLQLCRGPSLSVELVDQMDENPSTVRTALFRLKKYSLIQLGDDSFYSLTPKGEEYRVIFTSSPESRLGLPIPPSPPDELEQAKRGEEWIHAQTNEESSQINDPELQVSFKRASGKLQVSFTNPAVQSSLETSGPMITHDHQPDQPPGLVPSPLAGGRGRNDSGVPKRFIERFIELTDEEKTLAFEAVRSWKETAQPSTAEKIIISKMLSCVVFSPERPWNQKFFRDKQDAAEFFELTVEEFDEAMTSLGRGGRNFAYYREIDDKKKKVGIYLQWLELLRKGRWTAWE